jgi:hypothetical protein
VPGVVGVPDGLVGEPVGVIGLIGSPSGVETVPVHAKVAAIIGTTASVRSCVAPM